MKAGTRVGEGLTSLRRRVWILFTRFKSKSFWIGRSVGHCLGRKTEAWTKYRETREIAKGTTRSLRALIAPCLKHKTIGRWEDRGVYLIAMLIATQKIAN